MGLRILGLLLVISCGGADETILPSLENSTPTIGQQVPTTTWLRLNFSAPLSLDAEEAFDLRCDMESPDFEATLLGEQQIIINPRQSLSPGDHCQLSWRSEAGAETLSFQVAEAGPEAVLAYDRDSSDALAPFPDDLWAKAADTPTGYQIEMPATTGTSNTEMFVDAIRPLTAVDGFSPIGSIVIVVPTVTDEDSLPHLIDQDSLPRSLAESTDPFASVFIVDLSPDSPQPGARVPFFTQILGDGTASVQHLVIHPAQHLRPSGQYALVISNRAYLSPASPLRPSTFMQAGLGITEPSTDTQRQLKELLAPVLVHLKDSVSPAVHPDDIAMLLRFSIRSMEGLTDDYLSLYEQSLSLPKPAWTVTSVSPREFGDIAAVINGTWEAPVWNDGFHLARDADGKVTRLGMEPQKFVLSLPRSAETVPAPLTMYQHGTPGTAAEVVTVSRSLMGGDQDFATVGFTDFNNRNDDGYLFSAKVLSEILRSGKHPDSVYALAFAEQLAFLRFLPELATLDILPTDAPDGVPDLDLSAPLTYLGVSQGSNHGVSLMGFAPQIRAAALVVGGGRHSGSLLRQAEGLYDQVAKDLPDIDRTAFYVCIAALQAGVDLQDPANHARFIYQEPHTIVGETSPPSILMSEGLNDSFVPAWSTQSTADAMGIPLISPAPPVPFLEPVQGPLVGNINTDTTSALQHFTPENEDGLQVTEGCEDVEEGHFCPQFRTAPAAQRMEFFRSAIADAVPTISSPPQTSTNALRQNIPPSVLLAAPR